MSRTIEAGWLDAPRVPPMAAPLRTVDTWRAERVGESLAVTVRVSVHGDDPGLRGIPSGPVILPGIFGIEALCQAMALATPGSPMNLRTLRSVRNLAPVPAGDRLTLTINASPGPGDRWEVAAEGRREDGTKTMRIRAEFAADGSDDDPDGAAASPRPHTPPPRPPAPRPGSGRSSSACLIPDYPSIRSLLPQRHPLLLVDRVLEVDPGRSIRAIKAITGNEPCYAALPDGTQGRRYAYPRSLMIGSFGQSAMLLWSACGGSAGTAPAAGSGGPLLWVGARDYHFEGNAYPGDVLLHEVRLDYLAADTILACGDTWVGGRRVASVSSLTTTRRPLPQADPPP